MLVNRYKLFFVLIAVSCCILLSLRPVPNTDVSNDTGRYISYLSEYIADGPQWPNSLRDWSWELFYGLTTFLGLLADETLFLFLAASIFPLAIYISIKWNRYAFLVGVSLFSGFYGLEYSTNALRQSLGLSLVLISLSSMIRGQYLSSLVLGFLSSVAHGSSFLYIPYLLFVVALRVGEARSVVRRLCLSLGGVLLAVAVLLLAGDLISTYESKFDAYQESLFFSFNAYVVSPLLLSYILRIVTKKGANIWDEHALFLYSGLLILVASLLSPYTIYRIAMFAVPLQILMPFFEGSPGRNYSKLIAAYLFFQTLFILFHTDHFHYLIKA